MHMHTHAHARTHMHICTRSPRVAGRLLELTEVASALARPSGCGGAAFLGPPSGSSSLDLGEPQEETHVPLLVPPTPSHSCLLPWPRAGNLGRVPVVRLPSAAREAAVLGSPAAWCFSPAQGTCGGPRGAGKLGALLALGPALESSVCPHPGETSTGSGPHTAAGEGAGAGTGRRCAGQELACVRVCVRVGRLGPGHVSITAPERLGEGGHVGWTWSWIQEALIRSQGHLSASSTRELKIGCGQQDSRPCSRPPKWLRARHRLRGDIVPWPSSRARQIDDFLAHVLNGRTLRRGH